MNVHPPHRPVHESEDFWYYPKEAVLLYENKGELRLHYLEARHTERSIQDHYQVRRPWFAHSDPHGIRFKDAALRPIQQEMNAANVELVVRLCYELGLPPRVEETRQTPFLPVPKFLALFLEAKRAHLYKSETLTQAMILIQTHALSNRANATH